MPTLTEFNKILDSIPHDDKAGHFFTVDIKVDKINEKTLLFNEIPPPLTTRAGWLVTYIYAHCTFEQAKFKKEFIIMNEKSRQTATSNVEKDFYNLINNSNFGIDCRNNIDNCTLQPIYENFYEIGYIKNYTTIFSDEAVKDFFLLHF